MITRMSQDRTNKYFNTNGGRLNPEDLAARQAAAAGAIGHKRPLGTSQSYVIEHSQHSSFI